MRIVFFEMEDWEKDYVVANLGAVSPVFYENTLTLENAKAAEGATAVSVFIYSRIDAALLDAMPSVKLIVTRSMGYDHIDVEECRRRGITVARVPSYGDRTVAEHTFALILALSRRIFLAYERTEKGIFDYRGLQGFDLFGKTIGIVGGGRIGMNVARIAKAFGMNVLVHDPHPKQALAEEIGFAYADFSPLLAASDVVTLHCPYSGATHHMVNGAAFAQMKPGAILVNTARGGLVDTKALLAALESRRLFGAGLDVLEEECTVREERELMNKDFAEKCDLETVVRNHMLIARNDVIITPHIAFNSREAVERILATTVDTVLKFAAGKEIGEAKV